MNWVASQPAAAWTRSVVADVAAALGTALSMVVATAARPAPARATRRCSRNMRILGCQVVRGRGSRCEGENRTPKPQTTTARWSQIRQVFRLVRACSRTYGCGSVPDFDRLPLDWIVPAHRTTRAAAGST